MVLVLNTRVLWYIVPFILYWVYLIYISISILLIFGVIRTPTSFAISFTLESLPPSTLLPILEPWQFSKDSFYLLIFKPLLWNFQLILFLYTDSILFHAQQKLNFQITYHYLAPMSHTLLKPLPLSMWHQFDIVPLSEMANCQTFYGITISSLSSLKIPDNKIFIN